MVTTADGAGGTDEGPDSKKTTEGDQGFFAKAAREFLQPVFGVEVLVSIEGGWKGRVRRHKRGVVIVRACRRARVSGIDAVWSGGNCNKL